MKFQFSEKWLRRMADAEPGGLMACSPEIWGAMSDEEHWLYVGSRLRDGEPCTHPGCLKHLTHPCEGCGRVGGRSAAKEMTVDETAAIWEKAIPEIEKIMGGKIESVTIYRDKGDKQ